MPVHIWMTIAIRGLETASKVDEAVHTLEWLTPYIMSGGDMPVPRFCSLVFGHEIQKPSLDAVTLKLDKTVAALLAEPRRKAVSSACTRSLK